MWIDVDDARLREMWAEGLSASRIGVAMKRTKNSIIGRSHRLGLARRASPIAFAPAPKAKPMRAPRCTLAVVEPDALAVPDVAPVLRVVQQAGGRTCCWPLWPEGARPTHEYCGQPRVEGARGLYCEAHRAGAYIVPRFKIRAALARERGEA